MQSLDEILTPFRTHPDFLGIELTDVNQPGAVDDAPLHIACRKGQLEVIHALIKLGANVNLPGDLGNTPLHSAALTGKADVIELLLSKSANPRTSNEFGETPYIVAVQGSHKKAEQALKKFK